MVNKQSTPRGVNMMPRKRTYKKRARFQKKIMIAFVLVCIGFAFFAGAGSVILFAMG